MKKTKKYSGKTIMRLLRYIAGNSKGLFIISIICVILSTLAEVAGSLFVQILVDDYITPLLATSNPFFSGLITAILIMTAIYAIGVICTYIYNRFMVKVSQGVLKSIRDDMFNHMQSLPIRYFDTNTHGNIMSHYTNDTDTLRQFISQALPMIFSCAITVLASFIVMLYYSWLLSIIVIVITVILLLITKSMAGKSTRFFIRQQTSLGSVNGYIEEMFNGQKVVKVFCHERKSEEGFTDKNNMLYDDSRKANRYANILMPLMGQIGNLQYVILAFVGGILALNGYGGITAGIVIAFLTLSKNFSMPLMQIAQQISMVSMAFAGAERIFKLIDEQPETDDGYITLVNVTDDNGILIESEKRTGIFAWKYPHHDGTTTLTRLAGDIRMVEMDFGYVPEKTVLHDITLFAEPGQKIAFVGATGAGKTTITNLLNRFYDIADGKIRYDGININKIKKADLRKSLGIVLQDTYLFTGTIMDNIRYGRLDATDEECIAAAKLSNADKFISCLPEGYNTILTGAGAGLSQGQRQLLAIARAAVANPPVMILDEATSSIDTRTEKLVQNGMDELMKGRTTFVIAHRLSTIQNSDVIMVLDHGKIIERGNHESLIDKHGTYYQLYTGAFELE